MVRLSSIVGLIEKDLATAQFASDLTTRSLIAEYRRSGELGILNAPHVVIADAHVTLRFVVDDIVMSSVSEAEHDSIRRIWREHVVDSLDEYVAQEWPGADEDTRIARIIEQWQTAARAGGFASVDSKLLLEEKHDKYVVQTVDALIGALPAVPHHGKNRPIPALSDIRTSLRRWVSACLGKYRLDVERLARVEAVMSHDLEIDIRKEAVEAVGGLGLHELSLQLNVNQVLIESDG